MLIGDETHLGTVTARNGWTQRAAIRTDRRKSLHERLAHTHLAIIFLKITKW